jgi:uncharacterized protein YqhQ
MNKSENTKLEQMSNNINKITGALIGIQPNGSDGFLQRTTKKISNIFDKIELLEKNSVTKDQCRYIREEKEEDEKEQSTKKLENKKLKISTILKVVGFVVAVVIAFIGGKV